MSLVGNLEDLGLGEILQIVSLSRKTGILTLTSGEREGTVYFRLGKVVRAASSTYQQSLGEVLIQKKVIDLAVLRKALALQQDQGYLERLGAILVKNFDVPLDIVDGVVREQIENVIFSLFAWAEGSFEFVVQHNIETVDSTRLDPMQFMLDQGLNPQFLAMEGTRILDEKRHMAEMGSAEDDTKEEDVDLAFDLVDGLGSSVESVVQHVVIVDDDGPTLRVMSDMLTDRGFMVHSLSRSEEALVMVDSLHRAGEQPTVLIDLIMPKMDGSGVLGGLELLDLLHCNFRGLRIILMTDYHHADAEKKVQELGFPFILKPRRVEINSPAVMLKFISNLMEDIQNPDDPESTCNWQDRFNLGDELRCEMGADDDVPVADESHPNSGGFTFLRGMLEDLSHPDLRGGVLLLVLRFASEFFNRAIIFTISDNIISGSGQFGISGDKINGDERVRSIQFPLESGSMFFEPFRSGHSIAFKPSKNSVDTRVFEQLGGGFPEEIFIGPIVSQSQVIGFLYGDNLPEKHPVGDVESLVIFLSQAGIAIEKSTLERKLQERKIN